jgi:type II secretory pathway component GspD/PulD (secretin)
MFSKKITISIIFIFIFITYFDKNIIASSAEKTISTNPLRADSLNSHIIQKEQEYPQVYSAVNQLILNDMPVLIKEDVDKYLNDVSKKITARVIDLQKPKTQSKSKNTKKKGSKEVPGISFDFPNVTLAEFTRFVANLNKKILIGENLLQGNITIKTPKKLTLKRLMKVFQALLNSKGLSYMIAGKYMQIYQKSDSEVKVYQINYLKAKDLSKTLQNIFKMSFNVGGRPERIMVNSLDDANCVVVLAPKARQLEIEKAINMLDWRRRQVLLEIRVVEITYNNHFGFGISAGGNYKGTSGGMGPGMTTWPGDGSKSYAPTMPDIPTPYSGFRYDNGQFLFDLEAEEKIGRHKVLTQPRLLTSENQKAEINVGHQEPIQQAQTNMGTSSSGIPASETTVDWKDIGIKVAITPRINANRDVTLDFEMTSTSIVDHITVGSFTNYPVIGQRITKNTSTVMDKHTLVLGGLLKEQKKTQKYKFPFLGDMPMLGWMFTTFQETTENTELIMFITPHVIERSEEGTAVTKKAIRAIEDYDKENKGQIIRGVKGERDKSWDIFNIYDYFNDEEYKKEIQQIVPQTWANPKD